MLKEFFSIINDWLPSIGVIVSALLSFMVARSKTKSEIKKVLLEFDREDKRLEKQAFSEFMRATESYCKFKTPPNRTNAIKATADYLVYAPATHISLLKEMDAALFNEDCAKIKNIRSQILELQPLKI